VTAQWLALRRGIGLNDSPEHFLISFEALSSASRGGI
jgi:hypothetical protein